MHFFNLNFLNVRGILAKKNLMWTLFFVNFLMLKMGNDSNNQVSLDGWL